MADTYNLIPILEENATRAWYASHPGYSHRNHVDVTKMVIYYLIGDLSSNLKTHGMEPTDKNILKMAKNMLKAEYQEASPSSLRCGGQHPAIDLAVAWMKINHLESILKYKLTPDS